MQKLEIVAAFLLIMVATLPVYAYDVVKDGESWYNISGISKHVNTDVDHNERNWGVGYERYLFGRNWQVGAYKNSYYKPTSFLTTELTSYHFSDNLRLRLNGGLVTGYRYPITPMVLPVFTYTEKHWGVDILTIPSIAGKQGIYAAQLKLRF